jgi:hypothetical protein
VLYATGNSHHPALTGAVGVACIDKPYTAEAIVAALGLVADSMARAPARGPFPPGFRVLAP